MTHTPSQHSVRQTINTMYAQLRIWKRTGVGVGRSAADIVIAHYPGEISRKDAAHIVRRFFEASFEERVVSRHQTNVGTFKILRAHKLGEKTYTKDEAFISMFGRTK